MSAVESDFPQMGTPGNSLVACMPLTGLSVNEDNFLPEMREELHPLPARSNPITKSLVY